MQTSGASRRLQERRRTHKNQEVNHLKPDVTVNVSVSGVAEAQDAAEKLVETLKSAKSLAGDLADALGKLSVDIK